MCVSEAMSRRAILRGGEADRDVSSLVLGTLREGEENAENALDELGRLSSVNTSAIEDTAGQEG